MENFGGKKEEDIDKHPKDHIQTQSISVLYRSPEGSGRMSFLSTHEKEKFTFIVASP